MIKGIIFDLDGVIVSTDDYHYRAWKAMADKEGIPFDKERNNLLRGVSRRASLEIILEKTDKQYTEEEKEALMKMKNDIYVSLLSNLTSSDILPGFMDFLSFLKRKGIKTAIGSSSKNTKRILTNIGLIDSFDEIADGTEIAHSKPDPEVFLLAGKKLNLLPEECAVIEDAVAGIEAAKNAHMTAVAIKDAKKSPIADYRADSFYEIAQELQLD